MQITHKIYMHLGMKMALQPIHAVQGDRNSRKLALYLQASDSAWQIPEDAAALVRYKRLRDGTGNEYDTLPDGTTAWEIDTENSIVTVALEPAMFAYPGDVQISVALIQGDVELNTFVVTLHIQANPGADLNPDDGTGSNALLTAKVANLEERVEALENIPIYAGEVEVE